MNFSDFIRGDEKEAVMMDVMDKARREQLRTLALAATPGEWDMASDAPSYAIYVKGGGRKVVQTANQNNFGRFGPSNPWHGIGSHSDAAYIAAANPATLLALLDRIDELEGTTPTERAVPEITGETSDGYHTFNELYEFRKVYNAALFNEWAAAGKHDVHKSWRHHDGEECFGGGWFIVVAVLPTGQISNHYAAEDWGLFNVPECERAKFEFDGHTSEDVLLRLKTLAAAPGAGGE